MAKKSVEKVNALRGYLRRNSVIAGTTQDVPLNYANLPRI